MDHSENRATEVGAGEESLRTTDPLAKKIFEALRNRSVGERRFVLQALRSAGRSAEMSGAKEQSMRHGLELYQAETGQVPSAHKYETWRRDRNDPGFVSAPSIVRHFRTWNRALDIFGLKPMPDPTSLRLLSRGQRISDEDALRALKDCAKDLGSENFTIAEYERWAKRTLLARTEPGRPLPISKSIFTRRFGSFRKAKIEANLDPENAYHTLSGYSNDQLLDALRKARTEIDGRLSTARYAKWRRAKQAEAGETRETVDIPCGFTIDQRFGGWLKAVALVEDLPVDPHSYRGPPVFQADWIAEQLVLAYQEIGEPFFISGYRGWVKQQRASDPDFPPPDYYTVRRRAGAWPAVRGLVREASGTGELGDLTEALEFKKVDDER